MNTDTIQRLLDANRIIIIEQGDWWGMLAPDLDVNFFTEDDESVIHATIYHVGGDGYYTQMGEGLAFPREAK